MKHITLFLSAFILWVLLTFSLNVYSLIIGLLVALIVTMLFGKSYLSEWKLFYNPARYFWGLVYLVVFLWECLKANFDVAYRVLSPKMPIKPGIVVVKSTLKSDIAKTFLANSITMTPGTITIDVINDKFYIHWIYVSSQDPAVYTKKLIGRFEKLLKKVFE
ncbi:MAG: Na+/H+ antiporter subunit E [Candidatus Cloacimonadaceae bacterium]|nr:Na+/H+ antiporter subunit E [Candidatus Cloacimonadaceae bacterium]